MTPAEIDALVTGAQNQPVAQGKDQVDTTAARTPQFTDFESTMLGSSEVPIGMLMDLTLPISIELGRTNMTVQELLRLGRGAVIQLDRLAGEPIDIFVGDRRFAEGEVVVLGEHFGVRITRILSASGAVNQQVA